VEGLTISRLRMIVKGKRRKTAALPFFNNNRARRGVVGANGFLVVFKTATFIFKGESFDSGVRLLSRNVRLDNDLYGLFACDTGFALVASLIASLRAWDWRRIPGRLLLNSQRS